MTKKILFLLPLFIILMFLPVAKVWATNVYVGVQITATEPLKAYGVPDPGQLWCLPVGTGLTIRNSTNTSDIVAISPTQTTVTSTKSLCPGDTIWSGLVNLTGGTVYNIRIVTPSHPFCSGYYSSSCYEVWDAVGQDKDCNEICGRYGQQPYTSSGNCYDGGASNCNNIATLKGSPCTSCTSGSYSYYSKSDGACWYHNGYSTCNWSDPDYVRVCVCSIVYDPSGALTFLFPFTPTGI